MDAPSAPATVAAPSSAAAEVRQRRLVYAALGTQTLISAGTYLVAKRALVEIDPISLVICRFVLAGSVFLGLLAVMPGKALPPRTLVPRLLWLGFLAGPMNQGLFFYGLARSRPAHAALLYALTPLFVYVLTALRGAERPRPRALLGIAVAFGGVVVLLLGRGLKEATGPLFGDLFILAAVLAWALLTVEGKKLIAEHGSLRVTSWSMVAATAEIVPFGLVFLNVAAVKNASSTALVAIAYLALLTSVISYLLWYYGLSKTDASKVAVFANLQPVATAVAAWVALGDPMTWEIFVGGALVLGGVRFTLRT